MISPGGRRGRDEWLTRALSEAQALQVNGQWAPDLQKLGEAAPEEKRFYVTEAAGHLYWGKILPRSLAMFVSDLLLADVSKKAVREAARALAQGQMPGSGMARWMADWLLREFRPRGRPVTERPKELRVAAAYYLRRQSQPNESARTAVRAIAKEFDWEVSSVQKRIRKYSPMSGYCRDDLQHLLLSPRRAVVASPRRHGLSDAQAFLRQMLSAGPVLKREIERRASIADHSERTLARAKISLRIASVRVGRGWAWQLPPRMPSG
jgi:hypothetical protein